MAKRKKGRGRLRRLAAILAIAAAAFVAWKAWTWPDVGKLARENPESTAFVDRWNAKERKPRAELRFVPYAAISPNLKRAVLVAEDINFFSHHGFEVYEMKNALREAWEEKEIPRGASTLTQQLAKNLWLSPSRNPLRKIEEAILTRQLEEKLDKRRILDLYLNVVEFGPGVYGAEEASREYFGKHAADLDEDEAARLAAALPSPSRWNPAAGSRAAERYARRIRERMDRAQFLWKEI